MTPINRRLFILGTLGLIAAPVLPAMAQSAKAEIVGMVDGAAAAIRQYGLDAAPSNSAAETWNRLSQGLYVFVMDRDGMLYVHPSKELVGQNVSDFKDIKGSLFVRDILNATKQQTDPVWTEYFWNDPSVGKVRRKRVYSLAVDDFIVSGGYYLDD